MWLNEFRSLIQTDEIRQHLIVDDVYVPIKGKKHPVIQLIIGKITESILPSENAVNTRLQKPCYFKVDGL